MHVCVEHSCIHGIKRYKTKFGNENKKSELRMIIDSLYKILISFSFVSSLSAKYVNS